MLNGLQSLSTLYNVDHFIRQFNNLQVSIDSFGTLLVSPFNFCPPALFFLLPIFEVSKILNSCINRQIHLAGTSFISLLPFVKPTNIIITLDSEFIAWLNDKNTMGKTSCTGTMLLNEACKFPGTYQ